MGDAMSDVFFLVVGIIIAAVGLLLIMAKVFSYIQCTVPINATVVRLKKDYTYFRGITYTYYHPVVEYVVDGKSYTQMASFRTLRVTKYQVNSQMKICCNPKDPELIRFVGDLSPLPLGVVLLLIGGTLIFCFFL